MKKMMGYAQALEVKYKRFFLLLLIGLPCLTGCASWSGATQQPQSFSAYAETVFRRQNQATSQMMMLSLEDTEDPTALEELFNAEKTMQGACADLNAYAEQSQALNSSSLLSRAKAGKSIYACDEATRILENLLIAHDIPVVNNAKQPIE